MSNKYYKKVRDFLNYVEDELQGCEETCQLLNLIDYAMMNADEEKMTKFVEELLKERKDFYESEQIDEQFVNYLE